jgi:hypothetical protein
VHSKEEILSTFNAQGRLERLPFMLNFVWTPLTLLAFST